ncbi:MAG TPA: efflux RND transporter permease subunit [Gammaproteobacteria bacterium]|jgi:multidrug efflux pump subunit AcrB|nr:efflux RND transporter permease subunit [Gammaproteobacteria bacterium]
MDAFLKFLVRQKKFAIVFSFAFIAVGLLSFQQIQRDQFPSVDFEILAVTTAYPGASPEDVEQGVTKVIENELINVNGIKNFTSTSREGLSSIIVMLEADLKDVVTTKNDIRNAVNRVESLPEEVTGLPYVLDFNIMQIPILNINIDGAGFDYAEARQITDDMEKALSMVNGVSKINKNGYLESEIQIKVDPDKLSKYNISINEVISAISSRNARFTLGDNNQADLKKNIVILSEFEDISDIEGVVIKSIFDGPIIRLGDIAKVFRGDEEETSITRVNGTKGFILEVLKQEQSDIIRTVARVKERVIELQENYPDDLRIFYTQDSSIAVENRLDIIVRNGYIGLTLVLIVLGVFLSLKTAFWVAVSLPVTLLGTVAGLGLTGENINLISLSGFILVLGIVVDDSIIIAESIHHYKNREGNVFDNVVKGFKRVILPVFTTILTTILVMSSMFLMTGIMGKFIYVLPVVVIFALTFSFLEITFALPAHLANKKAERQKTWFIPVENFFNKLVARFLRWRYLIVPLFIALFTYSLYFAITQMPLNLFPSAGADQMYARVEAPNGSSAAYTEKLVIELEKIIMEEAGENLESVTSNIGSYFTNVADISIALIPTSKREIGAEEIMEKIKKSSTVIQGAEEINFSVQRPGPPAGEDVEINLISDNDEQRTAAANRLVGILSNMEGVDNINRDDEIGKPRIETVLDFDEMARLGVEYQQVYRHLKTAFSGSYATDVRIAGKDEDVRVYIGNNNYSENFIMNTKVKNRQGNLIPMSQFSSIRDIEGEPDFNHYDGERSVSISASVDDKVTTSQATQASALEELNVGANFPQVAIVSAGGAQDVLESMNSFQNAFIVSILGVFLLLAILFNSYSQPLLVLAAVPFSLIGVIWAFFFHGEPLSFFALTGSLALIGVIVNDSLVMVSHLNYIKTKKEQIEDKITWIAKGARDRLRAVVLTTLTTLAGVLPLAYGLGGTDYFLQPMVLALGYGLIFGTVMTLILLPCMYLMNYDFINWLGRVRKRFSKKSVA